jgi:hypothetical protein
MVLDLLSDEHFLNSFLVELIKKQQWRDKGVVLPGSAWINTIDTNFLSSSSRENNVGQRFWISFKASVESMWPLWLTFYFTFLVFALSYFSLYLISSYQSFIPLSLILSYLWSSHHSGLFFVFTNCFHAYYQLLLLGYSEVSAILFRFSGFPLFWSM